MDIASLRAKLDNIAEELAQLPEQDSVAIEEEQVEEAIEDGKTYAWINVVTGDHGYGTKEESSNWTHYIPMSDFSYFSGDEDYKGLDDETAQEEGWIAVKEEEVHEEEAVEETVEVPVSALQELMQLAGYSNYADKLQEYENEPDEDYSDTEDQLIGLSGGLNGPKKMYPASAPGDNPMDQEPREIEEDAIASVEESLYKSYAAFLEEAEIEVIEDDKESPADELEAAKAFLKKYPNPPIAIDLLKRMSAKRIAELEKELGYYRSSNNEDSTSMVGYAPKGTTIDPKTGRPVPPKSDGPKVKAEPGTAPPGTKIDPKTGKITVPKGSGPFIKNL